MKLAKDRVVQYPGRYTVSDVVGYDTIKSIESAPGTVTEVGTVVNADLIEDLYGYANETITISGSTVTKTSGSVTETTTISGNVITTTKTDGTITKQRTITISGSTITKAVTL